MNPALWAALGGAVALSLVLLGIAVAASTFGRRARAAERAARADVEALRERMEELSDQLAASRGAAVVPAPTEYVITTAGRQTEPGRLPVADGTGLTVTLGEPLVKLAAFGYGLRKALSPETRNRIAFEMRREVKRARKQRRRAARRTRVAPAQSEETAA